MNHLDGDDKWWNKQNHTHNNIYVSIYLREILSFSTGNSFSKLDNTTHYDQTSTNHLLYMWINFSAMKKLKGQYETKL